MKAAAQRSSCKAPPCLTERHPYLALTEPVIKRGPISVSVLALSLLSLCGCSQAGAPSFDLFGAFFPAWLLCAVLGIFIAFVARIFFVARNLTDVLPFQLSLCTSLGVILALLVWLVCFGR
jgi:YtcA family